MMNQSTICISYPSRRYSSIYGSNKNHIAIWPVNESQFHTLLESTIKVNEANLTRGSSFLIDAHKITHSNTTIAILSFPKAERRKRLQGTNNQFQRKDEYNGIEKDISEPAQFPSFPLLYDRIPSTLIAINQYQVNLEPFMSLLLSNGTITSSTQRMEHEQDPSIINTTDCKTQQPQSAPVKESDCTAYTAEIVGHSFNSSINYSGDIIAIKKIFRGGSLQSPCCGSRSSNDRFHIKNDLMESRMILSLEPQVSSKIYLQFFAFNLSNKGVHNTYAMIEKSRRHPMINPLSSNCVQKIVSSTKTISNQGYQSVNNVRNSKPAAYKNHVEQQLYRCFNLSINKPDGIVTLQMIGEDLVGTLQPLPCLPSLCGTLFNIKGNRMEYHMPSEHKNNYQSLISFTLCTTDNIMLPSSSSRDHLKSSKTPQSSSETFGRTTEDMSANEYNKTTTHGMKRRRYDKDFRPLMTLSTMTHAKTDDIITSLLDDCWLNLNLQEKFVSYPPLLIDNHDYLETKEYNKNNGIKRTAVKGSRLISPAMSVLVPQIMTALRIKSIPSILESINYFEINLISNMSHLQAAADGRIKLPTQRKLCEQSTLLIQKPTTILSMTSTVSDDKKVVYDEQRIVSRNCQSSQNIFVKESYSSELIFKFFVNISSDDTLRITRPSSNSWSCGLQQPPLLPFAMGTLNFTTNDMEYDRRRSSSLCTSLPTTKQMKKYNELGSHDVKNILSTNIKYNGINHPSIDLPYTAVERIERNNTSQQGNQQIEAKVVCKYQRCIKITPVHTSMREKNLRIRYPDNAERAHIVHPAPEEKPMLESSSNNLRDDSKKYTFSNFLKEIQCCNAPCITTSLLMPHSSFEQKKDVNNDLIRLKNNALQTKQPEEPKQRRQKQENATSNIRISEKTTTPHNIPSYICVPKDKILNEQTRCNTFNPTTANEKDNSIPLNIEAMSDSIEISFFEQKMPYHVEIMSDCCHIDEPLLLLPEVKFIRNGEAVETIFDIVPYIPDEETDANLDSNNNDTLRLKASSNPEILITPTSREESRSHNTTNRLESIPVPLASTSGSSSDCSQASRENHSVESELNFKRYASYTDYEAGSEFGDDDDDSTEYNKLTYSFSQDLLYEPEEPDYDAGSESSTEDHSSEDETFESSSQKKVSFKAGGDLCRSINDKSKTTLTNSIISSSSKPENQKEEKTSSSILVKAKKMTVVLTEAIDRLASSGSSADENSEDDTMSSKEEDGNKKSLEEEATDPFDDSEMSLNYSFSSENDSVLETLRNNLE